MRGTKAPRPSGIRRVITEAGDRANLLARLKDIGLFDVLYTDFTEIHYGATGQKAFLIPFLDHVSKLVLGWALGERAITDLALEAWAQARETLASFSLTPAGRIIHHDQDPVFTSYAWTRRLLIEDRCRVSYALQGARDNPRMESFFGRFKTENRSLLQDAMTLPELLQVVAGRIEHYNQVRRHSSIGYQAPLVYVRTLLREGDASQC
jgi:putative transposase